MGACGKEERGACCGAPVNTPPDTPIGWFAEMIPNCLEYAQAEHARGRAIAGIMCEYTPRELLMAAGVVPVCLCGGSADTIPAGEEELPVSLCPLIKSTYGYHKQRSNPFLEMASLVVAENTCDGKKKMYELLARDRDVYVLDLPQLQTNAPARKYWEDQLRSFRDYLQSFFALEIRDCDIEAAIKVMNRERLLRRRIAETMKADPPPLSGLELLSVKSSIPGIPADFEQYEKLIAHIENRESAVCRGKAVRVLVTGVPLPHGAERVLEIIEKAGGNTVAIENCTGLKPILEDVEEDTGDPIAALADKYYHLPCSIMTPNTARMRTLGTIAEEYKADCIIDLIWQGCLTYDVEARLTEECARKADVPYLKIVTEYSPSDSARIQVRIEALFETIRGNRCPG
jgi:benzoyl-CoA reductase/2-hydroxyglutaryl-CoA dehydratase subunit BcrC/BadD/HgdB